MARTVAGEKRKAKGVRKSSAKRPRTTTITKTPRMGADNTITIKRKWWSANWPFSTASTAGFYRAFAPTLGDIPNIAEYTALFDEYKVKTCKITFVPRFGEVSAAAISAGGTLSTVNNQFYLTYGWDRRLETPSGTYAASVYNTVLETIPDAKTAKLDKPVSITYTPVVVDSFTLGESLQPCPWMSTRITSQPMQCVYAFMHDANFGAVNGGAFSVDVLFEMTFQLKGQK